MKPFLNADVSRDSISSINLSEEIIDQNSQTVVQEKKIGYAADERTSFSREDVLILRSLDSSNPKISTFHKFIWTFLSAWMVFCVAGLGTLVYDFDFFRQTVFRVTGYRTLPQSNPAASSVDAMAYKK